MTRLVLLMLFLPVTLPAQEAAKVTAEISKGKIDFRIGKELVTSYHIGSEVAKPYFWPLNAAGGIPVTRAWPMEKGQPKQTTDHVHQKSAWFCHGDVIPEGIELKTRSLDKHVQGVDFWSETPGHGKIVVISTKEPDLFPQGASVITFNEWKSADGVKILDETRTITLKSIGTNRLLIVDIDLHASVCPITFGDTKEGSFGVRVSDQIVVKEGGNYFNAEGKKNEKEVWGSVSKWCDYVGKINEKEAGIAVFDSASNPFPAAWHSRGYGLMAANPFGRNGSGFPSQKGKTDLVKMAKGDHLKFRYGILLHTGDTKTAGVAEAYETFSKLK